MSEDAALAAARARIEEYRNRISSLDADARDLIFSEARNHNAWQDKDVSDDQLRDIYELTKYAPTSTNTQPMRVTFVRSQEAKAKLEPALFDANKEKTMQAPATAIIAFDTEFWKDFEKLYPIRPEMGERYANDESLAAAFAEQMCWMQGAYFILAVRAVGLDAGGMLGFDKGIVNEAFFAGTNLKTNFLCNIGYGDVSGIKGPRLFRYDFEEVCEIV